jgi:hypothetical protein
VQQGRMSSFIQRENRIHPMICTQGYPGHAQESEL